MNNYYLMGWVTAAAWLLRKAIRKLFPGPTVDELLAPPTPEELKWLDFVIYHAHNEAEHPTEGLTR